MGDIHPGRGVALRVQGLDGMAVSGAGTAGPYPCAFCPHGAFTVQVLPGKNSILYIQVAKV